MAPSVPNSSSPRRSSRPSSTRRASAGPKAFSSSTSSSSYSSSSSSGGSSSYAPAGYTFTSPAPLEIKRTVNITVEISSGTATASHMDVSQYHMPVTTSCYSPTSGGLYEYSAIGSEYETATTFFSSQESYQFIPPSETASSSSYEKSSGCWTQGSAGESEYLYEPSGGHSSDSKYQQQKESQTPAPYRYPQTFTWKG